MNTSPLQNPEALDIPDIEGWFKDLLVHEEEIRGHLIRLRDLSEHARVQLRWVADNVSEQAEERLRGDLAAGLAGPEGKPHPEFQLEDLEDKVQNAYGALQRSLEEVNRMGSIPTQAVLALADDDGAKLFGQALGYGVWGAAGTGALLALSGGGVSGMGPAEWIIGAYFGLSAVAGMAGAGVMGAAGTYLGSQDYFETVGGANRQIDQLGELAGRLEQSCAALDAEVARLRSGEA